MTQWGPQAVQRELITAVEQSLLLLLGQAAQVPLELRASPRAERLHQRLARELSRPQRLLRLVALLDSIHQLLCSGRHANPREIYYRHVTLFQRQQLSDGLVKSLCQTLELPRHYLRLVGTAKGLVRGHLRILEPKLGQDESVWVDGMDPLEPRGHSISPLSAHVLQMQTVAQKVFVVEKETVFHSLIDQGFLEKQKPCVLVTARGFPDVPSRYFLRRLQETCASDFFLLVDFDPSGLAIAATYGFGPEAGSWMQDDLTLRAMPLFCPGGVQGARPFGLKASDVLPLTRRDRAVALNLQKRLKKLQSQGSKQVLDAYQEALQQLLEKGQKYELDAVERLPEFIAHLL